MSTGLIMGCMAPKKKPSDRHRKQQTQFRLHPEIRQQLEKLVRRLASTISAEITNAIRERLEKYHLWPPPEQQEEGK